MGCLYELKNLVRGDIQWYHLHSTEEDINGKHMLFGDFHNNLVYSCQIGIQLWVWYKFTQAGDFEGDYGV